MVFTSTVVKGVHVSKEIDWKALAAPFREDELEFRVQSAGESNGRVWAICLCYVTARAIMNRLDEVCGPENWWDHFTASPGGGVLCGITIRLPDGRELTKWDGSGATDVEAEKGILSGALKRAAVKFGIGRYLYSLEETFAQVHEQGRFRGKTKDGKSFRWDPPPLPTWALPNRPADHDAMLAFLRKVYESNPEDTAKTFVIDGMTTPMRPWLKMHGKRLLEEYALACQAVEATERATGERFGVEK